MEEKQPSGGVGALYLCGTPIGNLEDMSLRLAQTLAMADVVAAEDTRNSRKLLQVLGLSKPLVSYHEHNRMEKAPGLVHAMLQGQRVALVSDAGMPGISDPGEELVDLCHSQGVPVYGLPGPNAAILAMALSGLPGRRFCFEGFLPREKKERRSRLEELAGEERSLVFYEAPHRLADCLEDMLEAFGERRISLSRELTKKFEETRRISLSQAAAHYREHTPRGEFALVVEGAAPSAPDWSGMDIGGHMEMYLAMGMDARAAMKQVARDRKLSKSVIYKAWENLKGREGD